MQLCLPTLSFLTLLALLIIASGKVDGKAVARRHSIRRDTDSSCNQEISNIITAFNTVKRDLEELKRSTDRNLKGGTSYPRDCYDAMMMGHNTSGPYTIQPNTSRPQITVCCDMETDGGGWTIIQRRIDDTSFDEKWFHYQYGFGIPCGSHWIGLENMHALTQQSIHQLRIELSDFQGNKAYADYKFFAVGSARNKYSLFINGYNQNSTAGDSLEECNGLRFTTSDSDNDYSYYTPSWTSTSSYCYSYRCYGTNTGFENCASEYNAGWWYDSCFNKASLNGPYSSTESVSSWRGIHWTTWKPDTYSLKTVEMKIRPNKLTE